MSKSRSTVALIGGAGYIGSVVARQLLNSGYNVISYDFLVYGCGSGVAPVLAEGGFSSGGSFTHVFGDLHDSRRLNDVLQAADIVVILAGLVGDPITKKYPRESAYVNDVGIQRVIDSVAGHSVRKVVFISTCSNYGLLPEDVVATEETALTPLSLYAASKVNAEKYLLARRGNVKYSATVLRFATAFGLSPRMRFDLTVNEFAHALASNQSLRVFDPDTWRPYCHVKDFARLIKLVIEDKSGRTDFEVFNAGGDGNNATKRTITQLIRKHTSLGAIEFAQNGGDPRNYRVSFKKVRETLGFLPEYDLEYGIKEVIAATVEGVFLDAVKHPTGFGNYVLEKHLTDVLL